MKKIKFGEDKTRLFTHNDDFCDFKRRTLIKLLRPEFILKMFLKISFVLCGYYLKITK